MLSGGGTGGHIYPAIAIANELKSRFPAAEFLFVGARDKMEMQKVPQAGYVIKGLWIAGLQRKVTVKNALFPLKIVHSLWTSREIIKNFNPNVVIGTGGFASGPLLQMANMLNIPTIIQEQNSYPGITNKILSNKATKICVAYDNLERFFPKNKIILTGNPVRQDLLTIKNDKTEAIKYFNFQDTKKVLLVLGGSLGARRINQLIENELDNFKKLDIQIIWQCGKLYFDEYKKYDSQTIKVTAFIDRMDLVYTAADIIISRSGASSVSELCIVAKPVLYIPSPNVAEDHQTKNAQSIVDHKAALMLKESQLDTDFSMVFESLLKDSHKQVLLSMNSKLLALPNATKQIVDEIVKLL
jgi:UDP-N-acetylglucosamine--N-acetylmuramyl-(pentapeptide) pyrophosphoryl-undecaprenol N-acetylglucosamine transferase